MPQSISIEELQNLWKFAASKKFIDRFNSTNLNFEYLANDENNEAILKIEKTLANDLVVSGNHRQDSWEAGWGQNHDEFTISKDLSSILPKYFGKYPIIRWKQNFIKPESKGMESGLLSLLIQSLVERYSGGIRHLYEFGCGTGSNLVKIREFNNDFELYGLDWVESSQKIINLIAKETKNGKLHSAKFDYFNPDNAFMIEEKSIVLTVASLEQTGENFTEFINYLIDQKPTFVIHIEPMWELLDPDNTLDSLSIRYFKKRNYLNGLHLHLQELSKEGKLEIDSLFRSFVGSFLVDGYSVVVWKPNL